VFTNAKAQSFTNEEFAKFLKQFPALSLPYKLETKAFSEKEIAKMKFISDDEAIKYLRPKSEIFRINGKMYAFGQFNANEDIIVVLIAYDNTDKTTKTMDRGVFLVYYSKSKNEIVIKDQFQCGQDYKFDDKGKITTTEISTQFDKENTLTVISLTKSYTNSKADNKKPEVIKYKPEADFSDLN
jgi:hypothetical protein